VTFDTGIAYRLDNLNPVPDDRDFPGLRTTCFQNDISVLEGKSLGSIPVFGLAALLRPDRVPRCKVDSKF
jgi:hypothetical protein